jgi:hypothetical protein
VCQAVADLVAKDEGAALEGFTRAVGGLSIERRQEMLNALMASMSKTWASAGTSALHQRPPDGS